MSLNAWEQQTLDSIKDGLAGSDPELAVLLTTFARLASAEEMPVQETIPAGSRRTLRWAPRPTSPGRVNLQLAALLLWLAMTAALITLALILSRGGGPGTCTGSWPAQCSHPAPG